MSAQNISLLPLSAKASGAVAARRAVGFDGAQVTAQGAKVMGVADYGAASGEHYTATAVGTAVIEAGGAIAVGDSLIADAQGRAIPSTGALAVKAGAVAVTSTGANGAILQGGDAPEFVFADAMQAAGASGAFIEVLLRR